MVGYIVPVHAAQESYTFIIHYETLLATFLGLIVLSLIVYLAHSSSRENKYLIHLSEIDPLTSIFNKETTQKLIDQKRHEIAQSLMKNFVTEMAAIGFSSPEIKAIITDYIEQTGKDL